jgi:hypothetical protein
MRNAPSQARLTGIALVGALAAFAVGGPATARSEPTVARQGGATTISGLHHGEEDCGLRSMSGKVVKRTFDKNEIVPTGIVLEARDGTRVIVGIKLDGVDDWAENLKREVFPALQRLTKPGRYVHENMVTCGNAEINTVETIR